MTGTVQCFDRLYVGHGQMIGHAELSRHVRAEIAQHNQVLVWAGYDPHMPGRF